MQISTASWPSFWKVFARPEQNCLVFHMSRLWTVVEGMCISQTDRKGELEQEIRSRFLHNISD